MERVYVNGYDGGEGIEKLSQLVISTPNSDAKSGTKDELTDDGRKLSKVCLSILDLLNDEWINMSQLFGKNHTAIQIHSGTKFGDYFKHRGYKVASGDNKQDGELQNSANMACKKINELYANKVNVSDENTRKLIDRQIEMNGQQISLNSLIDFFYDKLHKYRTVCHLKHIPKPRTPNTVYQMLQWLAAIQWNPMYKKLQSYFRKIFTEFKKEHQIDNDSLQITLPARTGSGSMVYILNEALVIAMFDNVSIRCYRILATILGHGYGHVDSRYACDFFTNEDNLDYPSSDGACFDLLVEICLRLNQQIRFLYTQCHNGPSCGGWRNCHYGNGIGGSNWQCNTLQCLNQTGDQTTNQEHKQTCKQECKQTTECGIKSPLQSFLEDGLVGFLPHQFSSPSCKLKCSVSNHNGIPCKSPMGFRNIGTAASHRKTGRNIKDVLEGFCGKTHESLNLLCAYLLCLLRRPPQTLCEMFTFYHNYLENWKGGWMELQDVNKHKNNAFQSAVNAANFEREYTKLDPSTIFASSTHNEHIVGEKNNLKGDLFSLSMCNSNDKPVVPCGRYLQPLSLEARCLFNEKQAGHYLSWIVYLTETFYSLLSKMLDECCKKCGAGGSKCHVKCCADTCKVRTINEDMKVTEVKGTKHESACSSIVNCRDTHATMYAYGFTFGSPYELSGCKGAEWKRTCKDFCDALKEVLDEDSLLIKLIASIDEFMWTIREPFSYLVLALWSASFVYLLYVYIGRLDTLHIRSHLRIPASHNITAQSLLAAARIGKLSKISYLQP